MTVTITCWGCGFWSADAGLHGQGNTVCSAVQRQLCKEATGSVPCCNNWLCVYVVVVSTYLPTHKPCYNSYVLSCCAVAQVWVKYKRSHMVPQSYRISRPSVSLVDLHDMPLPSAVPSRSSSAWWNQPVTGQPWQHQAGDCFRPGYDPLTATWLRPHQHQQQQLLQEPAGTTAATVVQDRDAAGMS